MDKLRLIKVFEDTPIMLQLMDQEKKDILSMRNIIGENNLNLQADGKLLISHYVGFVQLKNIRLLIYPKVARNVQDEEAYDKSFNIFMKMLAFTGFNQVKRINSPQYMGQYKGDIFELMIELFADEILTLFRRDVNRGYHITTENESFIKRKVDFTENIKKNSYRKHLHTLKYEEFSENILMNQIFKTVILNLVKKTISKNNRVKLGQALLWLEDVEQIKLSGDLWTQVKFSRLNQQYKTAFNMAKMFYQNSSPNLNKGDELTLSFLVPLNQLFEKFVYELLKKAGGNGHKLEYQGPVRYMGFFGVKQIFQMKPDISLMKDDQVVMIFDAKYKQVIEDEGNPSINQSDVYQMLAYSVKYRCQDIFLVYPKMMGSSTTQIELMTIEIPKEDGSLKLRAIQINLEDDVESLTSQISQYLQI